MKVTARAARRVASPSLGGGRFDLQAESFENGQTGDRRAISLETQQCTLVEFLIVAGSAVGNSLFAPLAKPTRGTRAVRLYLRRANTEREYTEKPLDQPTHSLFQGRMSSFFAFCRRVLWYTTVLRHARLGLERAEGSSGTEPSHGLDTTTPSTPRSTTTTTTTPHLGFGTPSTPSTGASLYGSSGRISQWCPSLLLLIDL